MRKQLEQWIRLAEQAGWTITPLGRAQDRLRWKTPDGTGMVITTAPHHLHDEAHAIGNIRSQLRRAGLKI